MSKAEAIIECIRSAVNLSRLADDDDADIGQWQRAIARKAVPFTEWEYDE